jgi:hypothetical protein
MSDLGNRVVGSTLLTFFTTSVGGLPTTLSGTPAISVYKNSMTESTSGVSLSVDYDSRTGLNQLSIDTSASSSFYSAGNEFSAVITTGTVGGVSIVGSVVASFRLTTERTNLESTTNAIARGTVTTSASTTSVPTSALTIAGSAASGVVSNQFASRVALFDGDTTTAGLRGAAAAISASSASNTPTLTVGALPATPASGDKFSII